MTTSGSADEAVGAAVGTDATGSLSVSLTDDGRVAATRCPRLDPSLRRPVSLDQAVRHAIARAAAAKLAAGRAQATAGGERPRAARVHAPAWEPLDNVQRSGRTPRLPDFTAARRALAHDAGVVTGTSDNDCVSVVLDPGSSTGRVEADPGWLANAHGDNVGAAVTQAFAAAYRRRDGE